MKIIVGSLSLIGAVMLSVSTSAETKTKRVIDEIACLPALPGVVSHKYTTFYGNVLGLETDIDFEDFHCSVTRFDFWSQQDLVLRWVVVNYINTDDSGTSLMYAIADFNLDGRIDEAVSTDINSNTPLPALHTPKLGGKQVVLGIRNTRRNVKKVRAVYQNEFDWFMSKLGEIRDKLAPPPLPKMPSGKPSHKTAPFIQNVSPCR